MSSEFAEKQRFKLKKIEKYICKKCGQDSQQRNIYRKYSRG